MTDNNKAGRPTIYNEELADLICERIATNDIGLNRLCSMYDDMPVEKTIRIWRFKNADFADKYRQAKMAQAELLAETLNELCDSIQSYMDSEGVERVDAGMIARQRLKVDTIKWQASKLVPKIYGTNIKDSELGYGQFYVEKLIDKLQD